MEVYSKRIYGRFAGIGSTIKYSVEGEDEIEEVKLVKQLDFWKIKSVNEISIDSLVGKKLNLCREGDYIDIPTQTPYRIHVLSIENPVLDNSKDKEVVENEISTDNSDEKIQCNKQDVYSSFNEEINENGDIRYFNYKYNLTLQEYSAKINNELIYKTNYGTKAQDIYDECCQKLNFDKSKRGKYGMMQDLYATDVTLECYSVWFVPHSNIYDSKSGSWKNYLSIDCQYIKEFWDDANKLRCEPRYDTRLTFIKQANGKYVFIGIFEKIKIDYDNSYQLFRLVQKDYK